MKQINKAGLEFEHGILLPQSHLVSGDRRSVERIQLTGSAQMHYESHLLSLPRSIHWAEHPGNHMLAWHYDALLLV